MNDSLAFQVELFADLMVQVDDPFAQREAVLIAAGLDDDTYRNLVDGWRVRFDRDATGSLAARFADAYAARRAAMLVARRREACGETDAADLRFLNADAQSFREDAAKVAREPVMEDAPPPAPPPPPEPPVPVEQPTPPQREVPSFALAAPPAEPVVITPLPVITPMPAVVRPPAHLAGTMAVSDAVPQSSLPFAPASASRAPEPAPAAPSRPHVPTGTADISAVIPRDLFPFPPDSAPRAPASPGAPVSRPPERFAGTADISAFVPRAATPFAPPPPAPPAPRKRLIRFDPQTGQPLPAPIWVDLPPEPPEEKK